MDYLGLKYLRNVDQTIMKHLRSNNAAAQEVYHQCGLALAEAVDDSRKVCDQILSSIAETRKELEKLLEIPQEERTAQAIVNALNILIGVQAKANTSATLPKHWLC